MNAALNFDGENDYVEVENNESLNPGEITVEAWVKPEEIGVTSGIVTKNLNSGNFSSYDLCQGNDNHFHFCSYGGFNGSPTCASAFDTSIEAGKWYFVTGTIIGTTIGIYVNGKSGDFGLLETGFPHSDKNVTIGLNSSNSQYFKGTIDEVAIYNRVLSPDEILDHYKRGALRLKYQVRSCDDNACSGETFIGPDGTASTYYSELNNNTLTIPSFNLAGVSNDRYFQYKTYFETDDASYSPELKSVTIDYTSSPIPTIQFTSTSSAGLESITPTQLELSLSKISDQDVTVDYAVTGGTATKGIDYTLANGTATITAGNSTTTIDAVVVDDSISESDETIKVNISNPTNAGLGTNTVHTYTIQDNDTAGITVNPTSGLITTEAGGTDTFTVVLDTQPTADVTIGLSSSDITEGTVLPVSLTFTSANWNTPQTVTVTGVDDSAVDGDITYNIITASASSTDTDYNGLNPNDVSVTNTDDDVAGIPAEKLAKTGNVLPTIFYLLPFLFLTFGFLMYLWYIFQNRTHHQIQKENYLFVDALHKKN